MTSPVDTRFYLLNNENAADVVYPMVFNKTGAEILWDGSNDPSNEVLPATPRRFDLALAGISNETIVVLGCKVKGTQKQPKDTDQPRKFVKTSEKQVIGDYGADGNFSVEPASAAGLDAAAFQDAYLKLSNPAVAKLLVAVANVISPELVA